MIVIALFVFNSPPQVNIEKKFTGSVFSTLAPEYFGLSNPQIAQLNDNIYFVWSDISVKDNEDVYFVWSSDNGATFSAPENLSDTPGNSTEPQIATYGNSTYVVWQDDTNGNNEVYLKISPAGKSAFGRIFNLSRNDGNSSEPQIATYGNSTYVVWKDDTDGNNEIYFRISPAGKSDFSRIFNLSRNDGNSSEPQIATYGNSTYAVWKDDTDGNNEVYFKISPAGKSAFGRIFNLSRNDGNSSEPQIATYGNSTYVVWKDDTDGNNEVYFKISPAGKSAFGRIFNLSRNDGNSSEPQITTYGNSTYVVWKDDTDGNNEVYFKISPAGKSAFGRIFNLSRNDGNSSEPQIATYGNSTYVVWKDDTTGTKELLSTALTKNG